MKKSYKFKKNKFNKTKKKKYTKGGNSTNKKLIIKEHDGGGFFSIFNKFITYLVITPNVVEIEYNVRSPNHITAMSYIKEGEELFSKIFEPYNTNKRIDETVEVQYYRSNEEGAITGPKAYENYNSNRDKLQPYHDAYTKYIKIKPHIQERIDERIRELKEGSEQLVGIFLRSNTLKDEQPNKRMPTREEYASAIESIDKTKKTKYFFCVDNTSDLEYFKDLYQPNYYTDIRRVDTKNSGEPHKKTYGTLKDLEDSFIEVVLLSHCDILVHCVSNMATASLYINMKQQSICVSKQEGGSYKQRGGSNGYDSVNSFHLTNDDYLFYDIFARNEELIIICPNTVITENIKIYVDSKELVLKEKITLNTHIYILLYTLYTKTSSIDVEVSYNDINKKFNLETKDLKKTKTLCITTLFKDDYYLLPLFVDYYIKEGVEHFYLYYNGYLNTVPIPDIIAKNNNVTLIEWPFIYRRGEHKDKDNAQPSQLNHTLYKYGDIYSHILFNDLDEYVYHSGYNTLISLINENKDVDSFGFKNNWCTTLDNSIPCKDSIECKFPNKFNKSILLQDYGHRSKNIHKVTSIKAVQNIHKLTDDFYTHAPNILQSDNNIIFHFLNWSNYDNRHDRSVRSNTNFDEYKDPIEFILPHDNIHYNTSGGGENSEKYTALIIEPRKHNALEYVLQNILDNLDNNWNIQVYHGNLNKDYLENIINNKLQIYKDRITLFPLNIDNLDSMSYSRILMTPSFYDNIHTELFLIFQTDSLINPKNKSRINDFLKYDYVGSPFYENSIWTEENRVGNGGFSLRRKSKMLEILNKCYCDKRDTGSEDQFFARTLKNETFCSNNSDCAAIVINKPSVKEANKFCCQWGFDPETFAVHKFWDTPSNTDINIIKENFPEAIVMQSLQNTSGGRRKTRKIKKGGNAGSKVITWIVNSYICLNLGGSEIMAHLINKYLINKGYIVNVIIHENTCSDTLYEGVHIINSNDTEKVKIAINSSSILFSQNYGYPELAVKKANEFNKPVVIFLHTHDATSDRNPEEYRSLIDSSKINIVYNSIWLKNLFNSTLNSIVLNPPINCADYKIATNNMYVSLLSKHKGEDIVLRIAEKMPDVKFLIIGGDENIIVNNITYKPNTKNVKEIHAITDIVLMPSVSESWGMVATEAMCSGIPTIASPTEGLKENLGYAGLFINRDSIDEWVSMIYKLKNDRTFYNDISNKCKARVQELDPTIQLENFLKFIDNILNSQNTISGGRRTNEIITKKKKNNKYRYNPKKTQGGNMSKAYVINIDKKVDRWERIQKDFANSSISLERFSAIINSNRDLGCGLSFVEVIKKAKNSGEPSVLIFEDDNKPLENFDTHWNIIKNYLDNSKDTWDIFNGGPRFKDWGNYTNSTTESSYSDSIEIVTTLDNNINICKPKEPSILYATNWMYINSSAYDRIISWDITKDEAIDRFFSNTNIFKVLFSIPLLGLQHLLTNSDYASGAYTHDSYKKFDKYDPIIIKVFDNAITKLKQ